MALLYSDIVTAENLAIHPSGNAPMEGWCRHRNLLLPNILSNVIEGTEGKI